MVILCLGIVVGGWAQLLAGGTCPSCEEQLRIVLDCIFYP